MLVSTYIRKPLYFIDKIIINRNKILVQKLKVWNDILFFKKKNEDEFKMKRILLISIALLIFIVGVSCASAMHLDLEKGTKVIGLDGPAKEPYLGSGSTKQQSIQNQGGNSKILQGVALYEASTNSILQESDMNENLTAQETNTTLEESKKEKLEKNAELKRQNKPLLIKLPRTRNTERPDKA